MKEVQEMATTKDKNTLRRNDAVVSDFHLPVKANVKINLGAMIVNDAGVATFARTAVGLVAIGRAELTQDRENYDNTGGLAGAFKVKIKRGCFLLKNSAAADAITLADVGKTCWIVDDETVAKTDGGATRSKAGLVYDVEAGGVWVEFGLGLGL
jgi:hypothetical protein